MKEGQFAVITPSHPTENISVIVTTETKNKWDLSTPPDFVKQLHCYLLPIEDLNHIPFKPKNVRRN